MLRLLLLFFVFAAIARGEDVECMAVADEAECNGLVYEIAMYDSYGDGWGLPTLVEFTACDGSLICKAFFFDNDPEEHAYICVPDASTDGEGGAFDYRCYCDPEIAECQYLD